MCRAAKTRASHPAKVSTRGDGHGADPDTALPTVAWITAFEEALDKPALTANQATAWYGLHLAGQTVTSDRLGALFRA